MSSWLYKKITGRPAPTYIWEMALEFRIPAVIIGAVVLINTKHFTDANHTYLADSKVGMTKGKLLEMRKLTYRYTPLPRYAVRYEYTVDGVKYVSTRGTTGSPYRNWMEGWYDDTITESQYLQSIPVLRIGERCTVFYVKRKPQLAALAHDPNSWETSLMTVTCVFMLLMGRLMKFNVWLLKEKYKKKRSVKVRFPVYDHPVPPVEPPPMPTHISPIPKP